MCSTCTSSLRSSMGTSCHSSVTDPVSQPTSREARCRSALEAGAGRGGALIVAASEPHSPEVRAQLEADALAQIDALYRTAVRLTRNPVDAEDLVQETYLRAFRGLDRFQAGTNLRAWLFKILTNAFINEYRRRSRQPRSTSLDDTEEYYVYAHLIDSGIQPSSL